MLGSNILNQIINEKQIINPCEILFHLNIGVNQALKQNKNEGNDGMDLSIISMHYSPDEKNYVRIKYAGANRPLYLIQNNIFEEIKATKKPIGGVQDEVREYIQHDFFLEKGSSIYLSTDGFADQFGGEFNKKMTTKKFKEQLMLIQHLNSQEKQKHLQDYFESWKGNNEQVDDVCVIGVCV
jgi:serine phosphatase RsbU (regulator of sigma subunit)